MRLYVCRNFILFVTICTVIQKDIVTSRTRLYITMNNNMLLFIFSSVMNSMKSRKWKVEIILNKKCLSLNKKNVIFFIANWIRMTRAVYFFTNMHNFLFFRGTDISARRPLDSKLMFDILRFLHTNVNQIIALKRIT